MSNNLNGIIKSIQNTMRKDHGVDGDAQRLSQLTWMLFLKIFDAKEKDQEIFDEKYQSPIPENLRWRNWADNSEGMTGDELLDFINNQLFTELKNLEYTKADNEAGYIIKAVFEDSYNYMKSGTQIRQVINKLNEINFTRKADQDQFGRIYEDLLLSLQSAGNAGEFYTPRALTEFIVSMLKPQLKEIVYDPACGTGGFLTSVIEYLRQTQIKTTDDNDLIKSNIKGNELKPLPHLLCITNMLLHGIAEPSNITRSDSLARPLSDITHKDKVDVIVANPPFGGVVDDGILTNFPATFHTKETADLFLVLFMKLLKEDGRAGIVLPDGSLTGDGVKARIRQEWLESCNLHTIIRLPNSVFAPYATVATNLLFFTKGTPTKEIWYYEHKLPETQKAYSKTKPIQVSEFEPIAKWWNNRQENELAWKVDIQTIRDRNYDLDIKNPTQPEEEKQYSSRELIDMLQASLSESQDILKTLEQEL